MRQLCAVSHYLHHSMHKSSRYFCSMSKVYPEYKIIILFRRFCFSIVLYEFSPYPICELKCLLQLQNCTSLWQAQSRWDLVSMMVSFPCLYWFFQLSVAQIIVSTLWFCLLCLIQKDPFLGGIDYSSRKRCHSYKLQRFHFWLLDWYWGHDRSLSFYVILTTGSFCWLVSC